MKRILPWCSVLALLFVPACGDSKPTTPPKSGSGTPSKSTPQKSQSPTPKKATRPVRIDMVMAKALWGNDPPVMEKVDNPPTPEKIALGRMLFHDTQLSSGGDMSCASCHDLANYGQDNKKLSPIAGGKTTARNTPTIWNAARSYSQFWDYRAANVEDEAMFSAEHGFGKAEEVVARIKSKPELKAEFAKAFPGADGVTAKNLGLALGAFQRTLVTTSRFDAFLDGDSKALTNEEKAGLDTFIKVGCNTCHMSRLVGGSMPQKLGVYGAYPNAEDTGRHQVSGNDLEKHFFKVPTLLNVEKTAPYDHDGGTATLEEAVKQMADIQLKKKISDDEINSIVTFLKALTGPLPKAIVDGK